MKFMGLFRMSFYNIYLPELRWFDSGPVVRGKQSHYGISQYIHLITSNLFKQILSLSHGSHDMYLYQEREFFQFFYSFWLAWAAGLCFCFDREESEMPEISALQTQTS